MSHSPFELAKEKISMTPDSQTITNHKTSIPRCYRFEAGPSRRVYKAAFGGGELFRIENEGSVVAQLSVGTADAL